MNKPLKELHEVTEEIVETAGRTAAGDGQLAEHTKTLGEHFEKFSKIAEQVLKPLELVTSLIGFGRSLYKSINIRISPDSNIPNTTKISKQQKRDVMSLFGVVAVGLAVGTFFATGVGALALFASGYVVSTFKGAYKQARYGNKAEEAKTERRALAGAVSSLLDNPTPKPSHLRTLSHRVAQFLEQDKHYEKQIEKRSETRFDLGISAVAAVAFIVAAIFPPITAPLMGIAIAAIAVGAGSKLKNWATRKFPRLFKSKQQLAHKQNENKYERLDEMLDHITPANTPNREKHVSFVHRIETMMSRIESPSGKPSKLEREDATPKIQTEAKAFMSTNAPDPTKAEKNLYHTDEDFFGVLEHRNEDHPRYTQFQESRKQDDDTESPV